MKCYKQVPRFSSQGAGFGVAPASPGPAGAGPVGCCSPKRLGPGGMLIGGGLSPLGEINLRCQARRRARNHTLAAKYTALEGCNKI